MEKRLNNLRQRKPLRAYVRNAFDGAMTLLTVYIGTLAVDGSTMYLLSPFIYATINRITKYVNTTYFNDLGVNK